MLELALPERPSTTPQRDKHARAARRRIGRNAACNAAAALVLLVASTTFPVVAARAGGLYTNEVSTASQANAGAGRGAWAPDASASIHNPATMTKLDDHAFATGFSAVLGNIRFDADSTSPSGTESGGNQSVPALLPSLSYVHKVSDRVRFGLGIFAVAGAALDPNNNWSGRFEVTNLSLSVLTISPIMAVRVTDWLSVGGGPIASYATLNWDLRVPPVLPPGPDRGVQLEDLDDWAAAGRVGLLFEPTESFSLSIYYNSETDFKLRGKTRFPAGLAPNITTDLPFPQFVEVSARWQVSDKIALLGTFNWEDWSTADKLQVTLGGLSTGATLGLEDTYKIGFGANYQLKDDWLLQTGIMYDTSGLKNKSRTTALPVDKQIRFAFGFQHALSEATTLGASFVYVNLGKGNVRQPTVSGKYKDNDLFILGLTLAFKQLPWSGKLTL